MYNAFAWAKASLRYAAAITALFILNPASLGAATIDVYETASAPLIAIQGELVSGDEKKFADIALGKPSALVALRSDGGNLLAGIEIGRAIRLKGFNTFVPGGVRCASACALAWLGGQTRIMDPNALIGFHAAFTANGQITSAGNALVGAYLNQLGLPVSAVIFITEAAPQSMQWLTPAEANRVGINVQVLDAAPKPNPPVVSPPVVSSIAPAAPAPSLVEQPKEPPNYRAFLASYFNSMGQQTNSAVRYMEEFYWPQVSYYGKNVTSDAIILEKTDFFKRWPAREYILDASSIAVKCSEDDCTATGTVAWNMKSKPRNALSTGQARFSLQLIVDGGKIKIIGEAMKVVARNVTTLEIDPVAANMPQ